MSFGRSLSTMMRSARAPRPPPSAPLASGSELHWEALAARAGRTLGWLHELVRHLDSSPDPLRDNWFPHKAQAQTMPIRSPEYMQQRRDHILDAALRCLQRQGLIDTSLTDICEEADISRGALYKHFASKDEILDGVLSKISQVAIDQLRFHDLSTMNSALTNWIDYIAGEGQKNLRLEFELMSLTRSNAALHAVVASGIAQRQSTLEESLKALAHNGEIVEDIDIRATARALNAFLFGLFSLASVAQVPKAVRRATLNAFLRGVVTKAVKS